jgi:hypothetical protein
METAKTDNSTETAAATEPSNPFADRAAAEAKQPKTLPSFLTITRNKRRRPFLGLLYGAPGIGKSTFAASAPGALIIPTERGLDQITVNKFGIPATLAEYKQIILWCVENPGAYESLIIDTADGLELLIIDEVCRLGKVNSIEDYGGGYGKGWTVAREIWVKILNRLASISETKTVLLTAHSHLKAISDPALGAAYDTHKPKIQDKSLEIIRQAMDLILFVQLDTTLVKESQKARKGRAVIGDERVVWTVPQTGLEAKNRFNLPNPMEFSWQALQGGIDAFYDK